VVTRARQVFAKTPDPTMGQIAVGAGVSARTLYTLFGSRAGLVAELGLEPSPSVAQQVVASAAEVLVEAGLSGLSVEAAAARAGVSRAAAYRLFPGKAPLFREVFRVFSPLDEMQQVLASMGDRPPAEVLPALAATLPRLDRVQLTLLRIAHYERDDDIEETRALLAGLLGLVIGYLDEQMVAGRLRRMDPYVAAVQLCGPGLMHTLNHDLIADFGIVSRPLAEVVDQLFADWLRSMRPPRRRAD